MSENLVEALFFSILALSMIIQTYNYLKPIERAAQKLLRIFAIIFSYSNPMGEQLFSKPKRNLNTECRVTILCV